ncbi:hypothetical protein HPO96_13415 [Kribbella sandramycini]|uniref:Uncharacterized protein n=1 Tax=Kribbella sandramycini TaxID=60450 RepID=A0A7Y4KYY6_9ACTN|nr:hypothetical protein [Kribbella sandramycini]MBB6568909.1 hypothetical protein [Kribbella sandramycini]NOL41245.1 hypothetical protein [Kribbella sandramycini]
MSETKVVGLGYLALAVLGGLVAYPVLFVATLREPASGRGLVGAAVTIVLLAGAVVVSWDVRRRLRGGRRTAVAHYGLSIVVLVGVGALMFHANDQLRDCHAVDTCAVTFG